MEGMHGDWQFMSGEEAREALEAAKAAREASTGDNGARPAEDAAEDAALAAGGWGAVELEATAPPLETRIAPERNNRS
jgi:hypothetical protein